MSHRLLAGLTGIALVSASGLAQQRVHTVEDTDYAYDLSTAPSLAVNDSVVVVAGSHALLIYDKGNPATLLSPPEIYGPTLPDPAFPFVPVRDPNPSGTPLQWPSFVFPRADFDPYTRRIWVAYTERGGLFPETLGGPENTDVCDPFLHLAIQKDLTTNPQTDFSTNQWWYYTGTILTSPQGATRSALDLGVNDQVFGLQPFRPDDEVLSPHDAPISLRMPSLAYDEDVVVTAVTTAVSCPGLNGFSAADQVLVIIPRHHSGGSTADGDRPAENEMVVARLKSDPIIFDASFHNLAVQEPYDQHDNIMLFISTTGADLPAYTQKGIRLKALFSNDRGTTTTSDDRWDLRQQLILSAGGNLDLQDITLPSGMWYRLDELAPDLDNASTPDFDMAYQFDPAVDGDFFTSAVLAKDNAGNDRVFAVHGVKGAGSGSTTSDYWRVQWYVIDPKLGDIIAPTVLDTTWQPQLIASGIIQDYDDGAEQELGHCYHPVIGVLPSGQAFIEYTFSNANHKQRIMRATLNSSYTAVASAATLQLGPDLEHRVDSTDGARWALWSDMQADPSVQPGACKWLWSTHTLVNDVQDPDTTGASSRRDIWLFRKTFTPFCFQTDMNADGFTDAYDMMMYSDYYTQGDERADTNADAVIEPTDMANYLNAYDAATQP
jgi:hypothetical protein